MHDRDRSRLTFKLVYALEHPDRIVGYTRRRGRDAWLALRSTDHVGYYRAVMRSDAARSREGAVGSKTHESWLQIGQLQFDYLLEHGLKPDMRMLEIGCGNLRAGRLFIDYLDAGQLLRHRHLPRHPAGRAGHRGPVRPAGQAAAPGAWSAT